MHIDVKKLYAEALANLNEREPENLKGVIGLTSRDKTLSLWRKASFGPSTVSISSRTEQSVRPHRPTPDPLPAI